MSSQTEPFTLKKYDFPVRILKKSAFSIQKWFCNRFGALSGSFWELFEGFWELSGASRSTKEGSQIHLGTLVALVCSPLAAEDGLGRVWGPSLARFGCSRWPLEGCFGIRHADFNHQHCPAELRYHIFSCCCCCCRRFPLTWQLLLDSARRNERSD